MVCVTSIIGSIFKEPRARPSLGSSCSKASMSALTCSGEVIFGRVTTKFCGSFPSALKKMSSVRSERAASSPAKLLMRMPMKGLSVPWSRPLAHCCAACAAWPSSSASARMP